LAKPAINSPFGVDYLSARFALIKSPIYVYFRSSFIYFNLNISPISCFISSETIPGSSKIAAHSSYFMTYANSSPSLGSSKKMLFCQKPSKKNTLKQSFLKSRESKISGSIMEKAAWTADWTRAEYSSSYCVTKCCFIMDVYSGRFEYFWTMPFNSIGTF